MSAPQYMVVVAQIVGSPESWSTCYSTDSKRFDDRQVAIDHGMDDLGHDDFSIGTVQGGALVAFGWGHEDFAPEDTELPEIARQLGLEVAA